MADSLKLGPFTGGLNLASDPSAIADNELVDCFNLELDLDGSLLCRPAIAETTNNGAWTERIVIIGRAILAGGTYLIGSNSQGTYAFNGTTWSTIKLELKARVALQYQDYVFIVAQTGSAQNGGYWDGTVWTTDANMPKGESAIFHKSRMFVVPGISATGAAAHQLRYTDPISISAPVPLTWTATNLIPVSQGDGQKLIDLVVFNDNLMLFKQDSTYVLAYDLQPADAILRKVNDNIGTTTRHSLVTWENTIYVLHEGEVYEISNYDFSSINDKVPFVFDGAAPSTRAEETFLCLFGDRLLVRYYNNIYVFGLRTRTWSRWGSGSADLHNFGPLVEYPSNVTVDLNTKYYGGSSILSNTKMYVLIDGHDAVTNEQTNALDYDITCSLLTKNYDIGDPHHFKKLLWWGADVITSRDVVGVATPIVISTSVTWAQLATYFWSDLSTWGQPVIAVTSIETNVDDENLAVGRKFIKFLKALRFRQINFQITLLSDGTTTDGPARFFTIVAIGGSRQTVVKRIS